MKQWASGYGTGFCVVNGSDLSLLDNINVQFVKMESNKSLTISLQ
jgi:hypothetical protein